MGIKVGIAKQKDMDKAASVHVFRPLAIKMLPAEARC